MSIPPNGNSLASAGIKASREPDAHGQAAILLVESLLYGLLDRSIISVEEAVEIVDVAGDVKREYALEMGDSAETMVKSLELLDAIRASIVRATPR